MATISRCVGDLFLCGDSIVEVASGRGLRVLCSSCMFWSGDLCRCLDRPRCGACHSSDRGDGSSVYFRRISSTSGLSDVPPILRGFLEDMVACKCLLSDAISGGKMDWGYLSECGAQMDALTKRADSLLSLIDALDATAPVSGDALKSEE